MDSMMDTTFFFPDAMKVMPIWILWKLEERDGRMTKVPYQANGRRASSTDPTTWATHEAVAAELEKNPDLYNGIGTVMARQTGLVFIDIDHCIAEDGMLDDRAEDILEAFRDDDGNLITYVELSQSGTGLHLFVKGSIPRCFNNRSLNVEMYNTGRFAAMTGKAVSTAEPGECVVGLQYVFERYKTAKKTDDIKHPKIDPATQKDDDWIIRKASGRVGGSNRFPALFGGDWSDYNSQSEADLALCKLLAFWTNNDPEAIDRLFRRSGLYRAKWERQGYRTVTIRTAINDNDDTLFDFVRRRTRERGLASIEGLS